MNRTLRLVLVVGVGTLAVVLMLTGFQRQMMFFPTRASAEQLAQLAAESGLEPWMAKGNRIGWKLETEAPSANVIVFHGNAGMAVQRAYFIPILRAAFPGSSIHILEYPGYGDREGSPSESSMVEAAVEGIESLEKSRLPLYLVGESIGTGVASLAAGKKPDGIRGLLLITPFDSLVSVAKIHYPVLPVGLIMTDKFESAKALAGLEIPMFTLIAEDDRTIPAQLGEKLYDGYEGPKGKVVVPAAGHNDVTTRVSPGDWKKIGESIREGLGAPSSGN